MHPAAWTLCDSWASCSGKWPHWTVPIYCTLRTIHESKFNSTSKWKWNRRITIKRFSTVNAVSCHTSALVIWHIGTRSRGTRFCTFIITRLIRARLFQHHLHTAHYHTIPAIYMIHTQTSQVVTTSDDAIQIRPIPSLTMLEQTINREWHMAM